MEIEDTETVEEVCGMCRLQEIRYVHYMRHPDYAGELAVGCDCAEKMEEDRVGPKVRDDGMRSRTARRAKWCGRAWKGTKRGNQRVNADGYICIVRRDDAGWCGGYAREGALRKEDWTWGKMRHPTADAAKLALFDRLWPRRVKVAPATEEVSGT